MVWLRRIAVVLGTLIVAAAIVLWLLVDHVTTKEMVRSIGGPGKVRCEVDRVHLSVIDGAMSIRGLTIGNPPGFPAADMFAFKEAKLDARVRTLLDQPIHVKYVEIVEPRVRLERRFGESNVKVFLRNIRRHSAAKKGKAGANTKGREPTRMIIDELRIVDGTVEVGSGFTRAGVPVKLATIKVSNLRGKDGRGITIGQLAGRVVHLMAARGAIQAGLDMSTIIPRRVTSGVKKATGIGGKNGKPKTRSR